MTIVGIDGSEHWKNALRWTLAEARGRRTVVRANRSAELADAISADRRAAQGHADARRAPDAAERAGLITTSLPG